MDGTPARRLPLVDVPDACSLEPGAVGDRLAEWNSLCRSTRRSQRLERGVALDLPATSRADIERLIELERACCSFLEMKVEPQGVGLRLTVTTDDANAQQFLWAATDRVER